MVCILKAISTLIGFVIAHLVLLLRPPLPVVEDDCDGRDILPDAGQHLIEGHPPRAVADVGQGRALGGGDLRSDIELFLCSSILELSVQRMVTGCS